LIRKRNLLGPQTRSCQTLESFQVGLFPPVFSLLFGQLFPLVDLIVTPKAKRGYFVVACFDAPPLPAAPIAVSRLDLLA
jgi:hypothetical protein